MRDRLIELLTQPICRPCIECKYYDAELKRPREYCAAESRADHLLANGVIVPPCKVGDTLWLVYTPKWPANPADKGKWFMIEDGVQRIIYGAKGLSIETWNMGTISAKEIGKKLFLTKEEAEKALAERSGQ